MIENDISECRICLLDGKTGASLYNDENATSYSALIENFTGFELIQDDHLSSLICDSCISELTIVIKFNAKVKTSYEKFKYFNNFDDSWEKNDSNSIKDEDDNLSQSLSDGVFTSIKDEQQSKEIGDIKQDEQQSIVIDDIKEESVDIHDEGLSLDNLIPPVSNGIFCPNADEENSPKTDIFNSEKLVSTFKDAIANRRLQKTLLIEPHIEKHSGSKEISKISKTDELYLKENFFLEDSEVKFAVVTSKEHGIKDKLECLVCGLVVRGVYESVGHRRIHTGERPYQCKCCDKNYVQSGALNQHIKKVHPEEWIKLQAQPRSKEISKISKRDGYLKEKIFIEDSEVKFAVVPSEEHGIKDKLKCLVCGLVVRGIYESVGHRRVHTGERPYHCKCCDKNFVQPGMLKQHIKKVHPEEWIKLQVPRKVERPTCDYCGASYTKKSSLIIHIRIHTNEKPFECSYCPKTFRLPTSFKNHVRARHTMEKPFMCYVCGKSYPASKNLRKHMRTHITEKKVKCNLCNAFVKTKEYLKRHIDTVHSTKKKICHVCGTAFSLTYNLNQHIKRRHSGQQKLESTSIGRTDARSSTGNTVVQRQVGEKPFPKLEKNMKEHADKQPFDCDFCYKRFFQRKHLLQHVKKHHN